MTASRPPSLRTPFPSMSHLRHLYPTTKMLSQTLLAFLVASAPLAEAAPRASRTRDTACVFTDAAAAIKGKTSCTAITLKDITVPAGQTLDMTGLKDGTHVTFAGTTTFGHKLWAGPLVAFTGNRLLIDGAAGHVIDCNGSAWWDGVGAKNPGKPKFFSAHNLVNSNIRGLNVKNTPIQAFSINGVTNLGLYDITIDNRAGDGPGGGHNTDGFDVGSSNGVTISGASVWNQDDCLAVNSGHNIVFTGGTCRGGHGLSIGSVGGRSDNAVANVVISNSIVADSANGVRVKTVVNATGSVSGVTYANITLSGISNYGIVVEQDYKDGRPTGHPTAGVPITGLVISNVTGTMKSSKSVPVYIICADGGCSNWTWTGVNISGGTPFTSCKGVPSSASC
ncbi:hypothetical protein RB600_006903 [Gaeumannomyces tritici]